VKKCDSKIRVDRFVDDGMQDMKFVTQNYSEDVLDQMPIVDKANPNGALVRWLDTKSDDESHRYCVHWKDERNPNNSANFYPPTSFEDAKEKFKEWANLAKNPGWRNLR
jgi:hypothetical protein